MSVFDVEKNSRNLKSTQKHETLCESDEIEILRAHVFSSLNVSFASSISDKPVDFDCCWRSGLGPSHGS